MIELRETGKHDLREVLRLEVAPAAAIARSSRPR